MIRALIILVLVFPWQGFSQSGFSRPDEEDFLSTLPEKPQFTDEEWAEIAGEVTEQLYIVQDGDTLWDICIQFFDSPFYWPKLWQVNKTQITNPHAIEVGMEIRFIVGSGTELPGLEISEEETPDFLDQSIDLLPEIKPREEDYDDLGFRMGLVAERKIYHRQQPHGLIVRGSIANYGEIVGSFASRTYLSTADIIYIDIQEKDKVQVGKIYSVYKYEGKVNDPDSLLGFSLGRWIRILGEVKILSILHRRARAQIVGSYGAIVRGSFITKRYPPKSKIQKHYMTEPIKADVVLLSNSDQTFEGVGGIIYLNRGSNDGIKVGTMFNVIASKDGLTESEEFVQPVIKGTVMVTHVEDYASTCIILESGREFYIGDLAIAAVKGAR